MKALLADLTTPITAPLVATMLQAVTLIPLLAFATGGRPGAALWWMAWCAVSLLSLVGIRNAWRQCRKDPQPRFALLGLALNYLYLFIFLSALVAYLTGKLTISMS